MKSYSSILNRPRKRIVESTVFGPLYFHIHVYVSLYPFNPIKKLADLLVYNQRSLTSTIKRVIYQKEKLNHAQLFFRYGSYIFLQSSALRGWKKFNRGLIYFIVISSPTTHGSSILLCFFLSVFNYSLNRPSPRDVIKCI